MYKKTTQKCENEVKSGAFHLKLTNNFSIITGTHWIWIWY